MKKLYVLRGVPGSGKSSFIRHHHLEPYTIATDNLRLLFGNLKYSYDETRQKMRQVIPQEYNAETFALLDRLITAKMKRGETIIVDATHLYPDALEPYRQYQLKYHYEVIVVDFTQHLSLSELLHRNQTRVDYRWVDPEVIKKIYHFAQTHRQPPAWVQLITPADFEHTLYCDEINLSSYRSIAIIGKNANFRGSLKPHEFYFTFNHDFAIKHQKSHHLAYLNQDLATLHEPNSYTVFPFYFRGRHYLVSAHNLRRDFLGPYKFYHHRRQYRLGLMNPLDFMQSWPMDSPNKHQINLDSFPQYQINRLA